MSTYRATAAPSARPRQEDAADRLQLARPCEAAKKTGWPSRPPWPPRPTSGCSGQTLQLPLPQRARTALCPAAARRGRQAPAAASTAASPRRTQRDRYRYASIVAAAVAWRRVASSEATLQLQRSQRLWLRVAKNVIRRHDTTRQLTCRGDRRQATDDMDDFADDFTRRRPPARHLMQCRKIHQAPT
jgi:hypothetical protein